MNDKPVIYPILLIILFLVAAVSALQYHQYAIEKSRKEVMARVLPTLDRTLEATLEQTSGYRYHLEEVFTGSYTSEFDFILNFTRQGGVAEHEMWEYCQDGRNDDLRAVVRKAAQLLGGRTVQLKQLLEQHAEKIGLNTDEVEAWTKRVRKEASLSPEIMQLAFEGHSQTNEKLILLDFLRRNYRISVGLSSVMSGRAIYSPSQLVPFFNDKDKPYAYGQEHTASFSVALLNPELKHTEARLTIDGEPVELSSFGRGVYNFTASKMGRNELEAEISTINPLTGQSILNRSTIVFQVE